MDKLKINELDYYLNKEKKTALAFIGRNSKTMIQRTIKYQLEEYEVTKIKMILNYFTYWLNIKKKTASISIYTCKEINIPRTVEYQNDEYIITKIKGKKTICKINIIKFPENSEIKIIEKNAFNGFKIEILTLPSSIIKLRDGWCKNIYQADQIIMRDNQYYSIYDDTLILGKSDNKLDVYDVVIFCRRNIKDVTIPSFIREIGSYSFQYCYINTIRFEENSQLQIINKHSFSNCSITNIKIPSNVVRICKKAFYNCKFKKKH